MNQSWHLHNNHILVRFPPLSGGKFFLSMLSYFEKFMYPVPFEWNRNKNLNFSTIDLKTLAHNLKLNSVPLPECKEYWPMFELKCPYFWGLKIGMFLNGKADIETSRITENARNVLNQYFCFHTSHEISYREATSVLPNCKIINLTGYEQLQEKSLFKLHDDSHRHLLPIHGRQVINFSMKNVFEYDKFMSDLSDLALALSGNNTFDPRAKEYYTKYMSLH